uniref:Non-selective voltage-gated ion channel VDAC2 n=1 Tax=Oryctolagus cuniculus TaxID=9986 RepID=A0A5F9D251_RABIT
MLPQHRADGAWPRRLLPGTRHKELPRGLGPKADRVGRMYVTRVVRARRPAPPVTRPRGPRPLPRPRRPRGAASAVPRRFAFGVPRPLPDPSERRRPPLSRLPLTDSGSTPRRRGNPLSKRPLRSRSPLPAASPWRPTDSPARGQCVFLHHTPTLAKLPEIFSTKDLEFSTSGSSNTDTGKVTGTLETKYKWCEYGLTFTEKWNTDNTLGTEIAIEDQICQGLKLTFDTTFSPNTGKKSGKIKSSYKRECINLGCDVDFDFAGPAIHGSAVFGYEGWLAGYQMTFDSAKSKLTRNNFAVGYRTGDFQLHTNVNDGTEFGGSIYQKVCEDLDTSVNLAWTSGTNCTRFGIAAKYQLDPTASISAKVNNSSLIGVGYTQTLRPGVKLTLSALVDGKSINAGGHKLGLALELEA